jgi:hypothetical protein
MRSSFTGLLAGQEVRVGMEACGHYPWFERLLAEVGVSSCGSGMRRKVRASVVRKQKTDRRDAEHLLHLLIEDRFPRIWVPSLEVRDVRQLLVHRHKQVQARTRTKNQLQAMALSSRGAEKVQAVDQGGARGVGAVALAAVRGGAAQEGCWKRWMHWKRRSANWTGEWRKKRASGRKQCG